MVTVLPVMDAQSTWTVAGTMNEVPSSRVTCFFAWSTDLTLPSIVFSAAAGGAVAGACVWADTTPTEPTRARTSSTEIQRIMGSNLLGDNESSLRRVGAIGTGRTHGTELHRSNRNATQASCGRSPL